DLSPEPQSQGSVREGRVKEVSIPFLSETEDTPTAVPEIHSLTTEESAPTSDVTSTTNLVHKSIIPGICDDSNSNEASMESEPPQSFKNFTIVNKEDTVSGDGTTEQEKRRWDVQQTVFDCRLPDVIPLPEETRSNKGEERDNMVTEMSSPRRSVDKSPSVERVARSKDASPMKPSRLVAGIQNHVHGATVECLLCDGWRHCHPLKTCRLQSKSATLLGGLDL
ncbi:hypothetical protein AVEN_65697-1, partial [Araneus ventricosus]